MDKVEKRRKIVKEILELKLKKERTLNDNFRIHKLQQQLDKYDG